MPYSVFQQLVKHPLTDIGLKKFLADWDAMGKKWLQLTSRGTRAGSPEAARRIRQNAVKHGAW